MKSNRNSPAATRQTIDLYLQRFGFKKITLSQAPHIATLPKDHSVYAVDDRRVTVKCYGKYGAVQLFVRGGIRLPSDCEAIEILRSVPGPVESADLEYAAILPPWLPEATDESMPVVESALAALMERIGPDDSMINTLLYSRDEYSKRAAFGGLRTEALRFLCADCYLSDEKKQPIMRESLAILEDAKLPLNSPYYRVTRLIGKHWRETEA